LTIDDTAEKLAKTVVRAHLSNLKIGNEFIPPPLKEGGQYMLRLLMWTLLVHCGGLEEEILDASTHAMIYL